MTVKLYAERDLMALDIAGGHYCRHVSAMTAEELHGKSDIAAELGWRDMQIAELQRKVEALAVESALVKDSLRCCEPTSDELESLRVGDFTPEELWGVGGKPSCPKCCIKTPATDAALAELRAQVWVEAKFYAKSMIESDACEFVDFLFDSKVQQLRGEAGL